MKDFRPLLTAPSVPASRRVQALLEKGHVGKAISLAAREGLCIEVEDLERCVRKLYNSGSPGPLLAVAGTKNVALVYSVRDLLLRALEVGDNHGFLKYMYRLRVRGLAQEARRAIASVKRRAPVEAEAWERKLLAASLLDE